VEPLLTDVCLRLIIPRKYQLSPLRNRLSLVTHNHTAVREKGYQENEWVFTEEELPGKLKSIFKREVPRSRKPRLFKFSDPKQLGRIQQKI